MENPFEKINNRLDDIERLIWDLKNQKGEDPVVPVLASSKFVNAEEAAKICKYKKGYIYELVFRNAIPHIKRGKRVLFDVDELENWIRSDRPSIITETIKRLKK